jgi:hypothetical protein
MVICPAVSWWRRPDSGFEKLGFDELGLEELAGMKARIRISEEEGEWRGKRSRTA